MAKYIVIEGDEGAGKTTQLELLCQHLTATGHQAQTIREPGGDIFAEKLRTILKYADYPISPRSEVLAFNAARANLLELVVRPLLDQDIWVLADRNYLSTLVYQGYAKEISDAELEQLLHICYYAISAATPDLMIVLDIPLEKSAQRMEARGQILTDRFETAGHHFRQLVNNGYRILAQRYNLPIINADQPPQAVHTDIMDLIQTL